MDTYINIWAVLAAAGASFVIGSLWYSPLLFAKTWLAAVGKKPEETGKPGPAMLGMLLGAFVTAYVMAHFADYASAANVAGGIQLGTWLWLGFVVTSVLPVYMFEGRPKKLYYLYVGYQFVAFNVMAVILAVWK